MDLQTAQTMTGRRLTMTKLATVFCFALACALMIGSLMSPGKSDRLSQPQSPLSSNSAMKVS
jgi:hypothetical protein